VQALRSLQADTTGIIAITIITVTHKTGPGREFRSLRYRGLSALQRRRAIKNK